jgi:pyridoxine 4-dehydrogenase
MIHSTKEAMSKTTEQAALTFKIGGELEINRLGYGGMQLTGFGVWGDAPNRETAKDVLQLAVEVGREFYRYGGFVRPAHQ